MLRDPLDDVNSDPVVDYAVDIDDDMGIESFEDGENYPLESDDGDDDTDDE